MVKSMPPVPPAIALPDVAIDSFKSVEALAIEIIWSRVVAAKKLASPAFATVNSQLPSAIAVMVNLLAARATEQ